MKRVFIGGIGRSGTSILLHALSFHPQLFTIPIETKFIVQVDGLHSLVTSLTTDYSPTHASLAVARFRHLMSSVITHRGENPYAEFNGEPYGRLEFLPQDIFPNYDAVLEAFSSRISDRHHRRRELIEWCRELVDGLFGEAALSREAEGWIEKTPSNIARIEFLYELYPDAVFINCIRDPRGVLHSFRRLDWIAGTLEEAASHLAAYYEYISGKRELGLFRPRQYYEIHLEDLVTDPAAEISSLLAYLGVAPYTEERNEYLGSTLRTGSMKWSAEQGRFLDAWERDYGVDEINRASDILAAAIREYGYSR
jgi:hypothetical protein